MADPALFVPAPAEWWPDTEEDWRTVAKLARPDMSDAEFERTFRSFWLGFQAMKIRMRGERRRRH